MKSALITGAAGQDGILLSQMLLADGYRVTGLIKPGTSGAVLHAYAPQVDVVDCDLADREGAARAHRAGCSRTRSTTSAA